MDNNGLEHNNSRYIRALKCFITDSPTIDMVFKWFSTYFHFNGYKLSGIFIRTMKWILLFYISDGEEKYVLIL